MQMLCCCSEWVFVCICVVELLLLLLWLLSNSNSSSTHPFALATKSTHGHCVWTCILGLEFVTRKWTKKKSSSKRGDDCCKHTFPTVLYTPLPCTAHPIAYYLWDCCDWKWAMNLHTTWGALFSPPIVTNHQYFPIHPSIISIHHYRCELCCDVICDLNDSSRRYLMTFLKP